jgi:hypothetical protein
MLLLLPARGTPANHAHRPLAACAWPARAVWDTESFPVLEHCLRLLCSPPAAAAVRSCLLVLGRWQSYGTTPTVLAAAYLNLKGSPHHVLILSRFLTELVCSLLDVEILTVITGYSLEPYRYGKTLLTELGHESQGQFFLLDYVGLMMMRLRIYGRQDLRTYPNLKSLHARSSLDSGVP